GGTGAMTLPDLYRERFGSPALGMLASVLVMFFLICNLVPQFTAGARIMKIVIPEEAALWVANQAGPGLAGNLDRVYYFIGLAIFTATVVAYTTYGGFLSGIVSDRFLSILIVGGRVLVFPTEIQAC